MAAPVPERDPSIDNARLLLVVGVVVGHFLEPFIDRSAPARAAYLVLYAFHMPLFAALSGAVSSSTLDVRRLLGRVLFPYLLLQLVYLGFDRLALGGTAPLTLFRPYWVLWYLLSLFLWRVALPFAQQVKLALPLSVLVALAAGYDPEVGYSISLSRTLVFFPFFFAGAEFSRHRARPSTVSGRLLAVALFVAAIVLAARFGPGLDPRWLYGSTSYDALGHPEAWAGVYRLGLFVAATLLGVSFLAFVPRGPSPLTGPGSRTLGVFLLHGFVVRALAAFGAFERFPYPLFWVGVAVVLAVALSTELAQRPFRFLLEPRWLSGGLLRE